MYIYVMFRKLKDTRISYRIIRSFICLVWIGKLNVKDNELEEMLKEATGPINFTMFLNLFGEKLHGKLWTSVN